MPVHAKEDLAPGTLRGIERDLPCLGDRWLRQAKTLEEGQRLIRDALSLFVDDAATAMLVTTVVAPPALRRAVQRVKAWDRQITRSETFLGRDAPTGSFVIVGSRSKKDDAASKSKARRRRTPARTGR